MEISIAKMQTPSPLFYISLTSRSSSSTIISKFRLQRLDYILVFAATFPQSPGYRPLPTVCSFLLQHCPNHWAVRRHLPHLPSRYIMRLTLTDHTDTANVVLFENEVAQLLQTSKDELSSLIAHENEVEKVAKKIKSIL